MSVAHPCLENVSPFCFWSLANQFPRLSRLHVQVRLTGNFGLNGSIPWFQNTDGVKKFQIQEDIESVIDFFLDCSYFRNKSESLWNKVKLKIAGLHPTDGVYICKFHHQFRWTKSGYFVLKREGLLLSSIMKHTS